MRPRSLKLLLSVLAALLGVFAVPAIASATTYYVSPGGSDSASGTSPSKSWRSLYRVNKAALHPGDAVLFKGGATFSDMSLQPGWGTAVSGSPSAPIVFGTYGSGRATLSQGVWLKGEHNLVYENFNLGAVQGIEGTGDYNVIQNCTFNDFMSGPEIGINVIGSHWTIRGNRINRTGDSGMLLRGDHFIVSGNTITNTGLDPNITYGSHGIYLKASNSQVTGNTITNFRDNGVSVRYHNSLVKSNKISGGKFGIAYFQWDTVHGTSQFLNNSITGTTIAGIYVSPRDVAGQTDEHIVIRYNRIVRAAHMASGAAHAWDGIALSPNKRAYTISGNNIS